MRGLKTLLKHRACIKKSLTNYFLVLVVTCKGKMRIRFYKNKDNKSSYYESNFKEWKYVLFKQRFIRWFTWRGAIPMHLFRSALEIIKLSKLLND